MQRLLSGSRVLLGLAALGLVAYVAVRLLARFWAWLALFVALAYLIMLAVTFAAILLYIWFGLLAELDVHAPQCDEEKREATVGQDDKHKTTGSGLAGTVPTPQAAKTNVPDK